VPPLRRMEDKIRSLCEQILAGNDDQEHVSLIVELRESLHQHVQRLRAKLAEYPATAERRARFVKHFTPEINCAICGHLVTLLTTDTCSNESGKPVHRQCYEKRAA
jgi:hypothetical protein